MPAIERALTRGFGCALALGLGGVAPAGAGDAVPLGPDTVKPLNVEVKAVEYGGKPALRLTEKPGVAVEADSLAVIPVTSRTRTTRGTGSARNRLVSTSPTSTWRPGSGPA